MPAQRQRDYLALNCAADVFLDQPGWSGDRTGRDALGCGLRIVTWPGELMRGLHALPLLRQMGLEETIATGEDGCVDLAARLGLEAEWRQSVGLRIRARRHLLFDDRSSVPELERFYARATSGGRHFTGHGLQGA